MIYSGHTLPGLCHNLLPYLMIMAMDTARVDPFLVHATMQAPSLPHDNGQGAFLHAETRPHEQLDVLVAYAAQGRHFVQEAYQVLHLSHSPGANLHIPMPIPTARKEEGEKKAIYQKNVLTTAAHCDSLYIHMYVRVCVYSTVCAQSAHAL